jgi:hypothetical protein
MSSREQAEASSAKSVSDSVRESGVEYCGDLLGTDAFAPYIEAVFMATLAQVLHLPATSSCAGEERGSCPLSRPLCNGTLGCVRPTCGDVTPLCNDNTDTGALRVRRDMRLRRSRKRFALDRPELRLPP